MNPSNYLVNVVKDNEKSLAMSFQKLVTLLVLSTFLSCSGSESKVEKKQREQVIITLEKYESILQRKIEQLNKDSAEIALIRLNLSIDSIDNSTSIQSLKAMEKKAHLEKKKTESLSESIAIQTAKLLGGASITAVGYRVLTYSNGATEEKLANDLIKHGLPKPLALQKAKLACDIIKRPAFKASALAFVAAGVILVGEEYYEYRTQKKINPIIKYSLVICAFVTLMYIFSRVYKKYEH